MLRILREAGSEHLVAGSSVRIAACEGVLGGPLTHRGDIVVALGRREGCLEGRPLDMPGLRIRVRNGAPRAHLEA